MNHERKPLRALTASLLMPGLGQIYNGDLIKGFSFFIFSDFIFVFCSWLGLNGPKYSLWLFVNLGAIFALFLYGLSIWDAYQTAKRSGRNYKLKSFNKSYFYVSVIVCGYFFYQLHLVQYTRTWFLETFNCPSQSMIPNIMPGDHFFVDKRVNTPGQRKAIQRGDMVIFPFPNDRSTVFIKRVIGLPGEKIEIKADEVFVNGKSIRGPGISNFSHPEVDANQFIAYEEFSQNGKYVVIWDKSAQKPNQTFEIPQGHIFVMGDNRSKSNDSRFFGYVPLADVMGKAKQVWLSINPNSGLRWGRFGKWMDSNE